MNIYGDDRESSRITSFKRAWEGESQAACCQVKITRELSGRKPAASRLERVPYVIGLKVVFFKNTIRVVPRKQTFRP